MPRRNSTRDPARPTRVDGRLTRREFVQRAGATAGGAAIAATVPALWRTASAAETLKLGFVSPHSGPLAGFGEADPYINDLVRKALANGLTIGGKSYAVDILYRDCQSDPARAGQLAKELINSNAVDFMLTSSTPEVVNPVADASEAAGVPCVSTVVPWESWYFGRGAKPGQPSPFHWTYHFSFGVAQFATAYISMWNGPVKTNKKVGVMDPNDADGNALRTNMIPLLEKGGFSVVDPGGYEDGTTDYSAQIAKYKASGCEIFTGVPLPPDFATFWRQAAQQGLARQIKIQSIAKTGLFPSDIEALGSLGYNIAALCYWHPTFPYPSHATGLTSKQLADGYERTTTRQWNQQLGATMALFDVGLAALGASGNPKNKQQLVKALSTLKVTTMVGPLDWTKGPVPNVSVTPLIGAQWVKAPPGSKYKVDMVIVDNADDRNVPVGAKLAPYRV